MNMNALNRRYAHSVACFLWHALRTRLLQQCASTQGGRVSLRGSTLRLENLV
jgi:hypothetical protein